METNKKKSDNIDVSLTKVKEMIKDIRYGNVILIIQDGKIIQIDKTDLLEKQFCNVQITNTKPKIKGKVVW